MKPKGIQEEKTLVILIGRRGGIRLHPTFFRLGKRDSEKGDEGVFVIKGGGGG